MTLPKRVCLPSSSASPSSSTTVEARSSILQGMVEFEAELLSRRQQEEEDRRLALLLQKELNQEERQRATDRRKGTSDAYLLRQNSKGKVEASSSITPRKSHTPPSVPKTPGSSSKLAVKTAKTPNSSATPAVKTPKSATVSSSSARGSKQATLTEMFSSLSS